MRNILFYDKFAFTDRSAASGTLVSEMDLIAASVGIDSISVEVKCADPAIADFNVNAPMTYCYIRSPKLLTDAKRRLLLDRRNRILALPSRNCVKDAGYGVYQQTIFYLQSITRIGPDRYVLYGLTPVGRLTKMPHAGGIYTGQTAEHVIQDICGDVPVIVKSNLAGIRLYGWLPYVKPDKSSARDNLAQVLFALGAYLGTDINGVLRVQTYWNGMSGVIASDRIYQGSSVSYAPAVSAVTVAEHQYIQGREDVTLFEGTALEGDIIPFSEPAHSLSAEGFSILASGANWARLSAGTGTLTGKAYVHTTREIRETVTDGAEENVKTEEGCTLVSLVNSRAAAQRLANYYRCQETIDCAILQRSERPGYVVGIYHPYDKIIVPACVSSMEITASSVLKAEIKALAGFQPPQYEESKGYDRRIVLTGTGEFEIPEGVTHVRGVLIEEGQGGASGLPGEAAAKQTTVSDPGGVNRTRKTKYYADGGKGGKAGLGGSGGRIYQFEIDVEPGQRFSYSCGPGGPGGAYSGEESLPGSSGSVTVFGAYSSASGSLSEAGFLDPVTNTVFGAAGEDGVDGGQGCGSGGESQSVTPAAGEPVVWQGKTYYPGNATQTIHTAEYIYNKQSFVATATEGLGGGAAAGRNGQNGGEDWMVDAKKSSITAKGGAGGDGADAAAPPAETRYGYGGSGGNGGGGAGSPGIAEVVNIYSDDIVPTNPNMTLRDAAVGAPGKGSEGGRGGPGCVLLYFTVYQSTPGGALMTRDGEFLLDRFGRLLVV